MLMKYSFSYFHTLNTVNYSLKFKTYFLFILTHTKFVNQWLSRVPNIQCDICEVSGIVQSCPTLGNLMDCSPPGSSVHGILQARTLSPEALPRVRTQVSALQANSLQNEPPRSPNSQSRLSFNLDFKSKICE